MNQGELNDKSTQLTKMLLDEMNPGGFWTGELSSSALAVAVAIAALHFYDPREHASQIQSGLKWLQANVNADGSFGDTPDSPGNVSTSLLVYAATNLYAGKDRATKALQQKIGSWLAGLGIDVNSEDVSQFILNHYQNDYTFSVPILTLCGLCGVPGPTAFQFVPQLPYELALLPRKFYRFLKLSVVSYAIPALVAVGIVVYKKKKQHWFWRSVRHFSISPALKRLTAMMPASGGFLEAIPLTAFVSLSLVEAGYKEHEVVKNGIRFLKQTQRLDGSWPIDVDLSTWVTSLSVKALYRKADFTLGAGQKQKLVTHLLDCQNKQVHPFNGSKPGGWGWTHFPGSVPDGDDTPGVILALLKLSDEPGVLAAVSTACLWLRELQNSDGGFPTFSRGWGKLPFDQSSCDLTGHCVLALSAALNRCSDVFTPSDRQKVEKMVLRAVQYLEKHQQRNGSWLPLWFGNQHTANHANPVYGTARVTSYLQDTLQLGLIPDPVTHKLTILIPKAQHFLGQVQNPDGSWGGDFEVAGSIEETALSISALSDSALYQAPCKRGLQWLSITGLKGYKASPIGLYFASLWYDEKLYPLSFYLEAVNRLLEAESLPE
ncbi:prenyltransferase/squalene oxidase repeat-containing protein [Mangrovibacterium lignilyticum]|uniref:prenyltransferase/squalene oxidase repeat-containing protein n=1 Tax=Mangrovibacterium lignilyticum TaxID=2668052 RepID=UPI0013D5A5CF|nr:prenyltransferase/squalene oxidase repeat-containing protein [Mangrovibacterium lignilyticum]